EAISTSKPRTFDGSAGSASTNGAPPSASPPHRSVSFPELAAVQPSMQNTKRDISSVLLLMSLESGCEIRSASEAIRASQLLRARYAKYTRRDHLNTGEKTSDPLLFHRIRSHAHLLRSSRAVNRERNIAQPDKSTRLQQLGDSKTGKLKIRNRRINVLLRRRVPFLDVEHFTERVFGPQSVIHTERNSRVTENDDGRDAFSGISSLHRVYVDARPDCAESVVWLGYIEHHSVLALDLSEPCVECRIRRCCWSFCCKT